ncbi:type I restriction enzyme HsdR N-terminal domain-containing protein [Tenuifilum osseticum]|uniref:type I restriction enzyme HsdR N-terminal domain-containing protein n=1 Tax=Tenuifilum osseticum TaxID=3374723 RepID=UPI0034E5508A
MSTVNGGSLNFPAYQFRVKQENGNRYIFDVIRKKFIALTPEEWVRQHLLSYLITDLNLPVGLIGVEVSFSFNGVNHRADVVVYNRKGEPILLAECKAPNVEITNEVVDQICRYNYALNAEYLLVTNGLKHLILWLSEGKGWITLDGFPELRNKI